MEKFHRNYKITFEIGQRADDLTTLIPEEQITIEYPFSLDFKTTNGINLSSAGGCQLRLYNLPEDVQRKLWKDNWQNKKYILMELCAGYQDTTPVIFFGFLTQCYSYRESGSVDYVTDIHADNNALISLWGFANVTITKDTEIEDVLAELFKNAPGLEVGYISQDIRPLKRDKTFIGQTLELLGREYGQYDIYIDKNQINILKENEVVPGDIMVITSESGLLGSPRRAEQFLELDMLFEPRIKVGQAIELKSHSLPWFNQIYKVVAVTHQGTISPVECGKAVTTLTLSLGDTLFDEIKKQSKTFSGSNTAAWIKPLKAPYRISDNFGWRIHPITRQKQFHNGIDMAPTQNRTPPVYAPANGRIAACSNEGNSGFGKYITLDNGVIDGKKVTSIYAHLSNFAVSPGDTVYKGQLIGYVGSTGRSTGSHLHFTVKENGQAVDPVKYIGK
jgi:hypothetical protein